MNGKRAKALRRIAKKETPNAPQLAYIENGSGDIMVEAISMRGVLKYFKRQIKTGNAKLGRG